MWRRGGISNGLTNLVSINLIGLVMNMTYMDAKPKSQPTQRGCKSGVRKNSHNHDYVPGSKEAAKVTSDIRNLSISTEKRPRDVLATASLSLFSSLFRLECCPWFSSLALALYRQGDKLKGDEMTGDEMTRGQDDQGTKWPGTKWLGTICMRGRNDRDKMTGDKMKGDEV
jgi:hypothetical protein